MGNSRRDPKTAGIGDPKARMEEIYSQVLTEAFNIRKKQEKLLTRACSDYS